MRIEFHLNKFHRMLEFQIISQEIDDDHPVNFPSCLVNNRKNTKTNRKVIICRKDMPDIQVKEGKLIIWLRGNSKGNDLDLVIKRFDDNEERDKYYDDIMEAFSNIEKLNYGVF